MTDFAQISKRLSASGSDITIAQLQHLIKCFVSSDIEEKRNVTPPQRRAGGQAPPLPNGSTGRSPKRRAASPAESDAGEEADAEAQDDAASAPAPSALVSLPRSEFVTRVGAILTQFPNHEIEDWFRRIDADDQKCVSWSEFSTFLMSRAQYQQQEDARGADYTTNAIPQFPPVAGECHGEAVTVIRHHAKTGRVFTGAGDGTVRVWSWDDMTHQRFVLNTEQWITDMCFLRNDTRLAVTCVDRSVTILDARSCEVLRAYEGRPLHGQKGVQYASQTSETIERKLIPALRNDRSALGLDALRPTLNISREIGARQHNETSRKLELGILVGLCDVPNSLCSLGARGNDDMLAFGCKDGDVRLYTISTLPRRVNKPDAVFHPHGDQPCNQLRYSQYLNGLISCGGDKAIHIINPDRPDEPLQRSFCENGHQRSVLGFAWSDSIKVLSSFSAERVVYLWDRMQSQPVNRIASLSAPVRSLSYNDHEYQLLVHTHDNALRIFDLRTNQVVQTLLEHNVPKEYGNLTTTIVAGRRIIAATTYPIAYLTRRELGSNTSEYRGHVHPCVFFADSEDGCALVSVDTEMLYSWNLTDGSLRFSFNIASFRKNLLDELRLTATCTDPSARRLVTGFHKGAVVIWNMSNGQALAQLHDDRFAGQAITAVLSTTRQGATFYIIAAGLLLAACESSSKQYSVHVRETCRIPAICGRVVTMATVSENTIACGTTSGAVVFLNIMSMTVEGDPLMPPVANSELHRQMSEALVHQSSARFRITTPEAPATGADASSTPQSGVRVEALKVLHVLGCVEPLIVATYSNGLVVLWNATWRTASSVVPISTISGFPTAFSFLTFPGSCELIIVYGDDAGNLYANRARIDCEAHATESGNRQRTAPELLLSESTVIAEATEAGAVSTLHCALSSPVDHPPQPDETVVLTVAVATLLHVEARVVKVIVPPYAPMSHPDDSGASGVVFRSLGVLGGDAWNAEGSEMRSHFSAVDVVADTLAPKLSTVNAAVSTAVDHGSIVDLLALLSKPAAGFSMVPVAAPRALLKVKSGGAATPGATRRRPTLAALLPSCDDAMGFENPVHMPPLIAQPPSTARVRLQARAPAQSPIVNRGASTARGRFGKIQIEAVESDNEPDEQSGAGRLDELYPQSRALPVQLDSCMSPRDAPSALQPAGATTTSSSILDMQSRRVMRAMPEGAFTARLRDAELKLHPSHLHVRTPSVGEAMDWTVRATARLTPRGLASYKTSDALLDVLQRVNPAAASRAAMASSAKTSIFGTLTRSRQFDMVTSAGGTDSGRGQ